MKEKIILNQILLSFSSLAARLFRNNVGMLEDKKGNKVRYGLCRGSSDLVGWSFKVVTPSMVGKKIAIFTAVEAKAGRTKVTVEQQRFVDAVNKAGGIGIIAHSNGEALDLFNKKMEAYESDK